MDARTVVQAVAHMQSNALLGQPAQRVIEHLDMSLSCLAPRRQVLRRVLVQQLDQHRIVDLQHQTRVDYCSILVAQRLADGGVELLVGRVELVARDTSGIVAGMNASATDTSPSAARRLSISVCSAACPT